MQPGLLSRRLMLAGATTALAAAGAIAPAQAKMPMGLAQAPYFYRFKHGAMEATVVSDGPVPLGDPSPNFLGISKEEMTRQLTDNFLSPTHMVMDQNSLVLNTGSHLILFDNGMGIETAFGPTTGKLMISLKLAGIDPSAIDAVVMTHAHIDHCGGIMAADGSRNFPNAQLYISQADHDYWTDEVKVGPKLKVFLDQARRNLSPNRDRIRFIKDGEEFLPGIHAIATPGHTVGHTVFMIDSGGKQICFTGDLAHHHILLLEKPLTEFFYDTDPKQSAQTRVRMLNMFAANRIPILSYHFPWPGIGHVAKAGEGFRYFPSPMQMVL